MPGNLLVRLFEHNNWANLRLIQVCSTLSDEQLDAEPRSATRGTIRATLLHLVSSQRGYLALLTKPIEERLQPLPPISDLEDSVASSGEGLLALAKEDSELLMKTRLQTTDGYCVEPWVVLLQALNHAAEHREQISSMLTTLGITPPDLDGWAYGEATKALIPISGQ
jgi:uncharacterized damage-inducible protein DinB